MTPLLAALVVALVGLRIAQAHQQHAELISLLNDLATMVGESFDARG